MPMDGLYYSADSGAVASRFPVDNCGMYACMESSLGHAGTVRGRVERGASMVVVFDGTG